MNVRNQFTRILNFFAPITPGRPKNTRAELEQSLKDTSEKLNQRIEKCEALRRELRFHYDIYLYCKGYTFDFEFDSKSRLLLLASTCERNRKNLIVYIPRLQLEIASLETHPSGDILAIDEIMLDFLQCDVKVGKFLLQGLIQQAKMLGLSFIMGQFGAASGISFNDKIQFYQQAGFEVTANSEEETGALQYKL